MLQSERWMRWGLSPTPCPLHTHTCACAVASAPAGTWQRPSLGVWCCEQHELLAECLNTLQALAKQHRKQRGAAQRQSSHDSSSLVTNSLCVVWWFVEGRRTQQIADAQVLHDKCQSCTPRDSRRIRPGDPCFMMHARGCDHAPKPCICLLLRPGHTHRTAGRELAGCSVLHRLDGSLIMDLTCMSHGRAAQHAQYTYG